jgi:K(+)-stimulated pyrophosphate-energized sodium pump
MNDISDKIKSGARAFLRTEYKYLSYYVVVVFAILVILFSLDPPSGDETDGIRYGACFLAGALLSASAGWGGMSVATDANVRTTQAADTQGLAMALRVAFTGGAVMGFTVVGLGLIGVSGMYYLVTLGYDDDRLAMRLVFASDSLAGFGFGASSIALFARVAGGIFTKAADVGADLVGKVEMDIPEDDPRNPAVIADNVGDNVGDVAGMGADLFESFVSTVLVVQRNSVVVHCILILSILCYYLFSSFPSFTTIYSCRLDPSLLPSLSPTVTLRSSFFPSGSLEPVSLLP